MRGSPRSVMLSWANAMAGWWTSATVSAVQRTAARDRPIDADRDDREAGQGQATAREAQAAMNG
jgi:hypothetical protein